MLAASVSVISTQLYFLLTINEVKIKLGNLRIFDVTLALKCVFQGGGGGFEYFKPKHFEAEITKRLSMVSALASLQSHVL